MNRHTAHDLKQMQSLPLEAKVLLTKQRIQSWYEAWKKYEIRNKKTGKTRFVTATEEPLLKENEYIQWETEGQVYVSFSGGKDSTVLKHIVDSLYDDVPALFVNTGLEYPEIQRFVREVKDGKYDCFNTDVEIVRPEMRFDEVIRRYGYPVVSKDVSNCVQSAKQGSVTRIAKLNGTYTQKDGTISTFNNAKWGFLLKAPFDISDRCCMQMKKKPAIAYEKATGKKPIIGMMAEESIKRRDGWEKTGCNAFGLKRPQSQPMAFWTEQDVLAYIKKYNVPYCSAYGDIVYVGEDGYEYATSFAEDGNRLRTTGCKRTGCIFCMFGVHLEKGENRFQRLKRTHSRQYDYCINGGEMVDGKWQPNREGLGLGRVLDYIGVKY